ncbi:MAG: efflux transporter periplasmic adaptor subunit [Micavibrio aeruginosavorus]|uniref:Efflux transporter periplasmic adaptor subunit n=1 Tax=Micavibrio aeruginosavorus TaxID=349221 RepID=A0A2W5PPQ3_9BACT|nr:MAG: efflux transporter periplasmic adaptor subunit [Micavibrio aeruginosavorus]
MKFGFPVLALFVVCALPGLAVAQKKGGDRGPIPVVVMAAYSDDFVDRVEAIGSLKANETVTMASTVTETVTAVNFTDGQRVKKGDILVEMTDGEEKALLDQQRALVNEANKQLQRAQELAKTGAVSRSVLEERQREAAQTKAGLGALQSRLQDHIIVAPFDGVVGLRNISAGALLQPATQITTLDDDSVMKLDFPVPSVFLPVLSVGTKIVARASGFEQDFEGEVSAIDSQIDPATRSVVVRALIPNPDFVLKPGLLMTVELLKNPRKAVGIPEAAIIPEGRKHFVLVVDESKKPPVVEKREIVIGTRREGDVEVTKNLRASEKVIVQGTMMAGNGSQVQIAAEQQRGETLAQVLKHLREKDQQAQKEKAE